MTLKQLANDRSVYIWRFLVLILLGLFGFFGTRLYAQIDRNQENIYKITKQVVMKSDLEHMQSDIREIRVDVKEINRYLRNKNTKVPG